MADLDIQSLQQLESTARTLFAEGRVEESLKKVWEVLALYPKSPVVSLGFRICRHRKDLQLADALKSFLEEHGAFNDNAKLDWAGVYCEVADPSLVSRTIDELLDDRKSVNWRIHALKTLTARGLGRNERGETVRFAPESNIAPAVGTKPAPSGSDASEPPPRTLSETPKIISSGPIDADEIGAEISSRPVGPELAGDSDSDRISVITSPDAPSDTRQNMVKQAMDEVRKLGILCDFAALVQHYQTSRGRLVRDDLLAVYLKSTSKCAEEIAESTADSNKLMECVRFAELVFGDFLALGAPFDPHHLTPMIEVHANAGLSRSAWKYLTWHAEAGLGISFRFQIWPIMKMLIRAKKPESILALAAECIENGVAIDAHGASLVGRALINLGKAEDAEDLFFKMVSSKVANDNYVLMTGLEILAARNRAAASTDWFLSTREKMLPHTPDKISYGLAVATAYEAEFFQDVVKLAELAIEDNIEDHLVAAQCAVAKSMVGDSRELVEIVAGLTTANTNPYVCKTLLRSDPVRQSETLFSSVCQAAGQLGQRADQTTRLSYARALEAASLLSRQALTSRQVEVLQSTLISLDPHSVVGLLVGSISGDSASVDMTLLIQQIQARDDSGVPKIPDSGLQQLLPVISEWGKISCSEPILAELASRKLLNTWHLGTVMNHLIEYEEPAQNIELLFDSWISHCNNPEPDKERILHNVLLKAFRRQGAEHEMARIAEKMEARGIEPDHYTLRELNQYSRRTPSDVGRRLSSNDGYQFQALTNILDDVRHELSHFVAKISLQIQTIADMADVVKAEDIKRQTQSALKLVQDFSKRTAEYSVIADLDSGGSTPLQRGIDAVATRFADEFRNYGIEFRSIGFKGHDDLLVNLTDYQLSTVLDGLISNSINALRDWNGKRSISIIVVVPKSPHPGDLVAITVKDSGPGISPEMERQIFEKGFTSRPGRGLGLGLTIIREIVNDAGGYIQYNPSRKSAQSGAEFLVQLLIGDPK
ncbi:MAG: sensor histidine kinase [Micrococcales bacterium]|nr:sensor histidine kinase [Micrococcales bacterium]